MPWVQPVCLAGGADDRSKQPAKMNTHRLFGYEVLCEMVRPGQVRSGQVRSGLPPVAAQKTQYVHNCYLHAAEFDNEAKCEFHTTSSTSLHDSGLRTCNTHEVWIPKYVVDGPRDEYQKDATIANVEPTDHAWPNSSSFCM